MNVQTPEGLTARVEGAIVRNAEPLDLIPICSMAKRFHQASKFKDIVRFEESMFARYLTLMTANGNAIALVLEKDKSVVGMLLGLLWPHYASGDLMLSELMWWVEPEERGQGLLLLDAFESLAKSIGVKAIVMTSVDSERAGALYERRGYLLMESSYIRRL